ncbi:MAG TPA: Rcas_1661 family thioredoxin-like (seleno)lipoprotein [Roseiflexaceae bacterium]|nr:Rcas_1661 family thioredoxin-like (seleno)lipoprotein [Roseiflexaceae bacterium]
MRVKFWSHVGVLVVASVLLAACNTESGDHSGDTPAAPAATTPAATNPTAATTPQPTRAPVPTAPPTPSPTVAAYGGITLGTDAEGRRYLGNEAAPITINHYADYLCRECSEYVLTIEPQIVERYVKSGQVKIIFHAMADLGNISTRAAEAAACAGEQGRYWEMRYALFQRQAELYTLAEIDPLLGTLATRLAEVEPQEFNACLEERETVPEILAQTREGREAGAEELPFFDINGQRLNGPVTLQQIEQAIQAAS